MQITIKTLEEKNYDLEEEVTELKKKITQLLADTTEQMRFAEEAHQEEINLQMSKNTNSQNEIRAFLMNITQ